MIINNDSNNFLLSSITGLLQTMLTMSVLDININKPKNPRALYVRAKHRKFERNKNALRVCVLPHIPSVKQQSMRNGHQINNILVV